jgi:hypothetical protein
MMTSGTRAVGRPRTRPRERLIRVAAVETNGVCSVALLKGITVSSIKRPIAGSCLVRRRLLAKNDPAKVRIRAWLRDIADERLSSAQLNAHERRTE